MTEINKTPQISIKGTELVWEGKYDKDGNRVAPLRVSLPFQTVETVNESAQERQMALEAWSHGRTSEWRNRLIWGDKKYVLPTLLDEFAGKVNLIYIDPPFATGADFSFRVKVDGEDFTKEPSIIEQKAYRDTWGRGLDSYLQWFYETAILLRELLTDTGSIYVHLDWHIGHYAKLIMDEIFGKENCRNEVIWRRGNVNVHTTAPQFARNHDTILFYSRSEVNIFYRQLKPYSNATLKMYKYQDERGPYRLQELRDYSSESIKEMKADNRIATRGQKSYFKQYLRDKEGVALDSIWEDISSLQGSSKERLNYPSQKPEALLDRIIKASSNEGDLVLDCFVGSGTTAVVAEKLNRRWIAGDLGRFAIHTTRKRLLSLPEVKPFVVQNLGKYERQLWQVAEFGEKAELQQNAYRRFILNLYKARPVNGYTWLHGVKAGRMVYVGAVDSPVSPGDVTQIVTEFRRAVGTGKDAPSTNGVDVLGWDFAFELNEVVKQQAARANINLRFLRIPREVLEKKAVEQGDIRFFELAALSAKVIANKRSVTVTLTDFVIPPDDVPEDVQRAITNWVQWIDYWAVDWDNKGDTFHNQWQTYCTRKSRTLQKSAAHTYDNSGKYTIVIKVIDILGNDTTKTVKVKVI